MARKSRAQQDAERLAALENVQTRVEAGEDVPDEVEGDGINDAQREEMYREIEERMQGMGEPEPERQQQGGDNIEDLRRELANMKRTISHYEQELNPAQRKAQQLEREVEELRARLASVPAQTETPTDYGLTEEEQEFETVTSIAEKVTRANMSKMEREIESLRSKLGEFEGLNTQNKLDAEIAKHRAQLSKALGGDSPDEYFSHPAISKWADEQAEEEALALRNPLAYSPKFIAGLLTRFKSEVLRGQAKREPSHGESSIPSRVSPDTSFRSGANNGSDPRFDPRTFQSDVQKLISNGKTAEAEKLIRAAERVMSA